MIDKVTGHRSQVTGNIFLWFVIFVSAFTVNCFAANEKNLDKPDSDISNFNKGVDLYKKQDYQKAQDAFMQALTSANKQTEADALYNIGNCKYKLGKLQENTDLSQAVSSLRESLDYYKRAIDLDQKNNFARFNYEFTEKELKVLMDKLKQQKPSEGKQNKQQQHEQEQKNQSKDEKEKQESGESQAQQQEEKEKKEIPQEDKKQQEQAQELQEEADDKKLSEEEARALLERFCPQEEIPNYMDKQVHQSYDSQVQKDW